MTGAPRPSADRALSPSATEPVPVSSPDGVTIAGACHCGKCLECDAAGYALDQAITTLGQRVKARCKELGLSLDKLAARTGLTKSYHWEIESGRAKNPTIRTSLLLCRALGWTLSECVGLYEHAPLLHPEALRIATEIDILLRPRAAEIQQ